MAVTVNTSNYSLLSNCDSLTSGGTWTGGNARTIETDFYKFDGGGGTPACIAYTIRTISNYQLNFSPTTSVNLTVGSPIIRLWFLSSQQFASQALGGIRFYITNGVNTAYWNVLGGDTYPGGWYMIAVDTDTTQTSGTKPTMTSITGIGLDITTTAASKNIPTTYIDHLHRLDSLITYGDVGGVSPYGIEEVYQAQNTTTTAYGVIRKVNSVYFLAGSYGIGDATGANNTDYADSDEVIIYDGSPMADGKFNIIVVEGTGVTDASFNQCVIKASGNPFDFNGTDTGVPISLTGNSFINCRLPEFSSDDTVTSNNFIGCNAVYPYSSTFENNTISASIETVTGSLYIDSTSTATNCVNLTFNTYSGKYAVYIPATVTGSITFDNWQFDGSGTDAYSGNMLDAAKPSTGVFGMTSQANTMYTTLMKDGYVQLDLREHFERNTELMYRKAELDDEPDNWAIRVKTFNDADTAQLVFAISWLEIRA